jgi:hypothetical protein
MSRYEAESIKFGEALRDDLRQQREKEAKEQESFAKKIAGADFAIKGINNFLKNRVDTFNASMLDEKAYLKTAQANAANILNTQKNIDTAYNGSVRDYMSDLIANQWQTSVEKNVEGMSVQTVDKNGAVVTRQAFDVPIATLKNMTNFTIGNKKYESYEDMLDERVEQFNNLVTQAKSVPSDQKDIDTYLERYVNQEMPTNIVSFLGRPVKRFFKGETKETLRDKVNRTTQENLNSPLFSNFQQFQGSFESYNKSFPGASADFIKEFEGTLERDVNNNIIDKRFKKIVKDVQTEHQLKSITVDNPETNRRETSIVSIPVVKKVFMDNTTSTMVGKANAVVSGEQVITTLSAPLVKAFEDQLNQFGKEQWSVYTNENKKAVFDNPVAEFSKFIESGMQDDITKPNKYLESSLDLSRTVESFMAGAGKDFAALVQIPTQQPDESADEYQKRLDKANEQNQRILTETLNNIIEPLKGFADTIDEQIRSGG